MGYGVWLHGEAVAAGTVMAARLSKQLGLLSAEEEDRIRRLIERAGLPVAGPHLGAKRYLELMRHDKKVVAGELRLILLAGIGRAVIRDSVPFTAIEDAILSCCE